MMATATCKASCLLTLTLIATLSFNIDGGVSVSPNCTITMTINSSLNQTGPGRAIHNCTVVSDHCARGDSWMCADLQSALNKLADLSQSQVQDSPLDPTIGSIQAPSGNSTAEPIDCVLLLLPVGEPHVITTPLFLGNLSVIFTGVPNLDSKSVDSTLLLPTLVCDYTVDVNLERIFDPDYEYIDYVLYFNRSELVVFDNLEFYNCPYPIRLNTVNRIRITNSTFG